MVEWGAQGRPGATACSNELAVTVASANSLNPFFPRVRRHEDDHIDADMRQAHPDEVVPLLLPLADWARPPALRLDPRV